MADDVTAVDQPKRMKGDEGEVEMHPLTDQIAAARFAASATAVDASNTRGLRYSKISPPGAA